MKIIIAEDNKVVWPSYEMSLRFTYGKDLTIDFVENGEELEKAVKSGNYDLIFTDNTMPVKNGLSAIKDIREYNKRIPIVMISSDDVKEIALKVGATDFISKEKAMAEQESITSKMEKIIDKHLK